MKALILAAGYATRLYPLTKSYSKALLKIGRRPIIEYIIEKLEGIAEIDEIMVITNSKFITQFRRWAAKIKIKKKLSLIDDLTKDANHRRGAVGDINFAIHRKHLRDDLLVIGGDNLFDGDLGGFLSFAKSCRAHPVIGLYNIKNTQSARRYGVVRLDKKNRITDFQEKPKKPESKLVAMCLYYFPRQKLGLVKKYLKREKKMQDAAGFYIDWLRRKVSVYGYEFSGCWYDIGSYKFYNHAKKIFSQRH